jgi:GNAT superfamily N-acetyltransferase
MEEKTVSDDQWMTVRAIDDGAPPATIAIREARRRDAAGLWALYPEFQAHHAHALPDRLRGFADPEAHRDDLYPEQARLFASPLGAVLVAEFGGEVVGLAEVGLREDADRPGRVWRRIGVLSGLMERAGARRRGVGARLLAAAEAWARARGAAELRRDAWELGGGPLSFYARRGYRTLSRTLAKPLRAE